MISNDYSYFQNIVQRHPKNIKTNWYVFTGPPCSGKTTSLNLLRSAGYKTNHDISRAYIEQRVKEDGIPPKVLRGDEDNLQKNIFCLMLQSLLSLKTDDIVIHDYSLPDNIAFLKLANLTIPEAIEQSVKLFIFRGIFIFEPLPLDLDGIRTETKNDQLELFRLNHEYYLSLGYTPIIVPKDTVENRHSFIRSHLPNPSCI